MGSFSVESGRLSSHHLFQSPDTGTALSQLGSSSHTFQSNLKRKRPQPRQSFKGLRGRYGCRTCRQRHLKCDEVRPTCENCARAKRDCFWNHEIRISHDPRSSASQTKNSNSNLAHLERSARKIVPPSALERSVSFVMPLDRQDLETVSRKGHGECLANVTEPVCSPRELLTFALEGQLFQFYIEHAGPWLDITSPSLHFASTTPRLALSNPVLLLACLAYAARAIHPHCSLSEQYSGACIKLLIPLLSDEGFVGSDETLLATLVILRHVEQYAEAPQDHAAHLSGAFSLVALRPEPPPRSSLPGAALWLYMRQDIRQALLNRAPPKLKPSHGIRLDNFDEDGGESSWADRVCYLAALACTFAWGDTKDEVDESYLSGLLDWWVDNLPQVYHPYHESEGSVRFLAPWHVVAWQFYHLARILIRLHSDRPRYMCVLTFMTRLDAEVSEHARSICKIAYSSRDIGCSFNASAILGFVGGYFRDKRDREQLIAFLQQLTRETNWPTHTDQDRLREIWSLSEK